MIENTTRRWQRLRTRFGRFGSAVCLVGIGSLAGIIGTTLFSSSPNDAAAERSIPELPPATVKIEMRELKDAVAGPCENSRVAVNVTAPTTPKGMRSVVTLVGVQPGSKVTTGTLLAVVSNQPVVAFEGSFPFYRDLAPGDTGDDVAQLEGALSKAGLLPSADTRYDSDTGRVVASLNAKLGGSSSTIFRYSSSVVVPPNTTVASVEASVGDTPDANTVLMELTANTESLECRLPEDLQLSVGDTAELLTSDSSQQVLIRKVAPAGAQSSDQLITVSAKRGTLKPTDGFTVQIVRSRTDGKVPVVPAGALRASPSGGFVLDKMTDDGVHEVPVEVGLSSAGYVQVAAPSLNEGDRVVLQSDAVTTVAPASGGSMPNDNAESAHE